MKLKNGKAAEADNIPAEALKANIDTTVELLYPLFARYGRMRSYQLTGGRVMSLNFQRRAISVNVPTTEEFLCSLCLEKFSTGSSWRE